VVEGKGSVRAQAAIPSLRPVVGRIDRPSTVRGQRDGESISRGRIGMESSRYSGAWEVRKKLAGFVAA